MDQAILNALEIFDNLKHKGKLQLKRKPEDFGPGDAPKHAHKTPDILKREGKLPEKREPEESGPGDSHK